QFHLKQLAGSDEFSAVRLNRPGLVNPSRLLRLTRRKPDRIIQRETHRVSGELRVVDDDHPALAVTAGVPVLLLLPRTAQDSLRMPQQIRIVARPPRDRR